MSYDTTLIGYFLQAGLVVKGVMLLLLSASIFSWAIIFQRFYFLKSIKKASSNFENLFGSTENIAKLYAQSARQKHELEGLESIFYAGFHEFLHFRKVAGHATDAMMENTKRSMRVAAMREQNKLEQRLSFLAIIASTSPYIGLFGTVWGIMQAFHALANVQQATIALVAPGIAEALIATALGLFAAIPALIAYNRFVNVIHNLISQFDAFQEELTNILLREAQHQKILQEESA